MQKIKVPRGKKADKMKALKKIGKAVGIIMLVLIILLAVTLTVTSVVYHIKLNKHQPKATK